MTYGEEEWQSLTRECLAGMENFGMSETTNAFDHTLGWMQQWACSRSFGLGTRLPWDPQYLVESLSARLGEDLEVVATLKGSELEGCAYKHPLYARTSPVVIGGDYITTESGTGLVHTAPGHGQDDFQVGQKYGLPILSPVDNAGRLTKEAGEEFEGLNVLTDANGAIIEALEREGALLLEELYEHKYPYDWRTKKPTIFRATEQWFASVDGFKSQALDAIDTVQVSFFPSPR